MAKERTCPHCGSTNVKRLRFTWWGGFVGPWLLRYVRCGGCGKKSSLRPGRRRLLWIVLYNLCALAVGGALLFAVAWIALGKVLAGAAPAARGS